MKTRIEFDLSAEALGDSEQPSQSFYYLTWADDTDMDAVDCIDGRQPLALKVRIAEDLATQILRDSYRL